MSPESVRLIALAHAVLAWSATGALILAVGMFAARVRARTKLQGAMAAAAVLLATLAGASGALLHLPYRREVRQRLFLHARDLGWLFERKQHLAFGAVLLALCGLCALFASRLAAAQTDASSPARTRQLHRTAFVAFAASALFAAVASVASTLVAARAHL